MVNLIYSTEKGRRLPRDTSEYDVASCPPCEAERRSQCSQSPVVYYYPSKLPGCEVYSCTPFLQAAPKKEILRSLAIQGFTSTT